MTSMELSEWIALADIEQEDTLRAGLEQRLGQKMGA